MIDSSEQERILHEARSLIAQAVVGDPFVQEHGQLLTPIAVKAPDGSHHSWLVPVIMGDKLVAWLQFLPQLELLRYSTFLRNPQALASCPDKADWLDKSLIRSRAMERANPEERVGEPFLTYDREPTRLVWSVRLTDQSGHERILFVLGKMIYDRPSDGNAAIGG